MPRERYQDPTLQQTKRGVWFIRPAVDRIGPHGLERAKKTIVIGRMGKREAQARANEIMRTINRADYVITSQIKLGAFLEEFEALHVSRLAASTRGKYRCHIQNHVRELGKERLCDLDTLLIQKWLDSKKLSWATKTDLRNILSCIFTKAREWGRWKDQNPVEHVHVGRKVAIREKRKLTEDQTRRLLAALPYDLRIACCVCLFSTLRVSEVLGLQEKHLNFMENKIHVRQRFYRGDLDIPKNDAAVRDLPMGYLAPDLKSLCKGEPERFVFQIETKPEWGKKTAICRDDRDLNQHFLRPAAVSLGFYWKGFGWHALRREAVTAISATLGVSQAMKMAGHTSEDMSLLYTLSDYAAQEDAVRARQESVIGKTGEKVQ